MRRPSQRVLDVAGLLIRLGLAAVWLVSGWLKLTDPGQTYLAVQAYEVLPESVIGVVATAMPLLELVLGLLLLAGGLTRLTAVASAAVLLVFIAAVIQSWARGLTIDCGCFGGGGQVEAGETRYPQEIARDTGFLLLAVWLMIRPRTLFSADGWLGWERGRTRSGEDDEPEPSLAVNVDETKGT
ncbi:MauE/DoxX family redox-associated membrane protein [Amycolatopsis palatopharyngis]|uniref:MauE/DoxX family redox-associated membrane protein n=1 Tax=Amycolatopsis palatopharyngis TaxID=187982 RepID=UPI001B875F14|nr:MauE/DoxX family redox-associated membrane protein [Amycolatopsis palatopharyngis]